MSEKQKTNFDYNSSQSSFFDSVKKIIVQQPDFKGIGGHGFADHNGHSMHKQTSIGTRGCTINFRELKQ